MTMRTAHALTLSSSRRAKALLVLSLLVLSLLVLSLLALATPALAQDWAGRGRLQGIVTGPEGQPLEGAKVTLYHGEPGKGPAPLETNKKGRWSYLGLTGGSWNIIIEYPDMMTSEGTAPVSEFGASKPFKIQLKPIPKEELQEEATIEAVRQLDLGNDLLQAGKFAEAREVYESALEKLGPEYHHLVKIGIANTFLNEGNPAKAVATLEPLLAEHGDELQLQHALARAYYQAGQVDESLTLLKGIVEANPDDVGTLRLLIDLLVRADQEEEAQLYIAKLPEGEKLSSDTLLNTGIKFYNDGKLDQALEQFDRAVSENPELPEAFYFRGLTHLGKQQNSEAITDFKRFLELAPEHAQAGEARQFLEYLESL